MRKAPPLFWCVNDAAAELGCSTQTIRRWLEAGVLELAGVTTRGDRLLDPEHVRKVARTRKVGPVGRNWAAGAPAER